MRQQPLVLMGVTVILSAACLGAGKAPGVPELSAQQILEKTAENYRGVTGYAFTGSVVTHMVIQDQVQDIVNSIVAVYGGPGRSRFEVDTPSDRTVLVTAGDSTFTYASALAQYSVQPATVQAAAMAGLPALDPAAAHPFAGYGRLADHVAEARLVGQDTASVNGKTIPTYVVDIQYDTTVAPPSPTGVLQKPKRLTIDAREFLVVGDETSLERSHPALPKPIHIEQSARYSGVSWNAPQPDSMFAFNAPPSAARVIRVGEPGGGMEEEESALTGKPADDFTLPDLKGVKRALSSHRGKVVLLDFWATWCGPCRREMPIIAKLSERYAKRGLVVYGVNCSEPHAKAKAFVDKYGYTFPMLLDRDGSVQTRYQITAIPTVFIVDKKGTISAHLIGGRTEDELVAALGRAGLDTSP